MIGRHAWRFWLPALLVIGQASASPIPAPDGRAASAAAVGQVVMGILSYTRWPQQPEPIRLCVTGEPAYAAGLLDDEARPSTPAAVARAVAPGDPSLAQDCDAVYLGGLSEKAQRQVLQRLVGRPVVSIIEDDAECAVGGMFCLDIQPDRVGFQVNLDSVARSGVRIHPAVLQLSRRRPPP